MLVDRFPDRLSAKDAGVLPEAAIAKLKATDDVPNDWGSPQARMAFGGHGTAIIVSRLLAHLLEDP